MEIRLIDTASQPSYCRPNYYEFELYINHTFRGFIYLTRKEWAELEEKL